MAKNNKCNCRCYRCIEMNNIGCQYECHFACKYLKPYSYETVVDNNFSLSSDYSKHDHVHCFNSKNQACGQKIKHFECCICGEPHTDITKIIIEERKRIIDGAKKISWFDDETDEKYVLLGTLIDFINYKK